MLNGRKLFGNILKAKYEFKEEYKGMFDFENFFGAVSSLIVYYRSYDKKFQRNSFVCRRLIN